MRPTLTLLVILGLAWASLRAADSAPVPFIIGGDEVVEPSKVESFSPLSVPAEPVLPALDGPIAVDAADDGLPALFEEPQVATTESSGDLEDGLPLILDIAPKPSVPASPVVASEVPAVAPQEAPVAAETAPAVPFVLPTPAPVVVGPAKEEDPVAVAPKVDEPWMRITPLEAPKTEGTVAATSGEVKSEWGPSYEVVLPAPKIVGPDGSSHVEGLEHVIGRSNPLLPEVKAVSPAIATVGEKFPELHVDQIPLEDLMNYLKGFTPKSLTYALSEPVRVSVELKPASVEEVFYYIAERYNVDVVVGDRTIVVQDKSPARPEEPKRAVMVTETAVPVAMTREAAPVVAYAPAVTAVPVAPLPAISEPAATVMQAPVSAYEPEVMTESMWRKLKKKASLYDLERERQDLLSRRDEIERSARNSHLKRVLD